MTTDVTNRRYRAAVPRLRLIGEPGQQTAHEVNYVTVHGYRRAYRMAGSGPVIVLLHGIGDSSGNWVELIDELSRDFTVIAPDMLGHGLSDKPRADYSVAAYANGLRDLLGVLGLTSATFIGHSLGGGVAMQFAYQFPALVDRLVIVDGGGAGREVTIVLRALSTPLAPPMLLPLRLPFARAEFRLLIGLARLSGLKIGVDAHEILRVMPGFDTAQGRSAFLRTLRAVVDWRGQVVTMLDRCYLAAGMPTQIIWGDRDGILPVDQAYRAHAAMPGSRLEIFEGAGHFPHRDDPERFLRIVREFIAATDASDWDQERWREQIRAGVTASVDRLPTG